VLEVGAYVPHQPPMLLIDEIVDITGDQIVCRTTIHPDCVFAIDGRVHASAMIEFVAQACAAYVGVLSRTGDPPRLGLIMGSREISFDIDSFAVGDDLTITATKVFGHHQVASFTGTVMRGGTICARVQLSVIDAQFAATHNGDAG
jgi:predicted hotdog family 3-hydroxylacyl-ACP dehydratase